MMSFLKRMVLSAMIGLCLASGAQAANVPVNANIATSTTWTKTNVYNLVGQIYVLPGATLTIEAGTVIKSNPADQGSLAICRGAKIVANGTKSEPIIFTSTNDTMTAWREGCNEWGNITIMGRGFISASHYGGTAVSYTENPNPAHTNVKYPDGLNLKQMEGLTAAVAGDPNVLYGGDNDDDDSGTLRYVSLRYGGKVLGLANELNGLSLGAVGRETDIDHIDIMNNVDDGIEIWGGTVNLKHLSIWNIGDDSLDIDEGYRGKIQFVLIVQGYSTNASQGSGVGDNCCEIDGAEDSDAQPATACVIYNLTAIGQPVDGDQGTAWRDNASVQYRNCIFMDLGEKLISLDNTDGDGAQGYGYNGTYSWADRWSTSHDVLWNVADTKTAGHANVTGRNWSSARWQQMYAAQSSGNLCELKDSVFYNNVYASAYTESNTRGVTVGGASAPLMNNVVATVLPVKVLTRGTPVTKGGKTMVPVATLDPRAANDAATSAAAAPNDGFFTPAMYRGAFSADYNWAKSWTAAGAYGYFVGTDSALPAASAVAAPGTSMLTQIGTAYVVQYSTDGGTTWTTLSRVDGDGTVKTVVDSSANMLGTTATKLYRWNRE